MLQRRPVQRGSAELAERRASGTSAHLAWRWPAASLPPLGPWPVTPQTRAPPPPLPWPGWRLRHPGLGAPQKVWGGGKGWKAWSALAQEDPLPPRAAGWGRGTEAFRLPPDFIFMLFGFCLFFYSKPSIGIND